MPILAQTIVESVKLSFDSCRGRRRDCAHLCTGDGLHRAVLAPVGKATPGSFLPRLHPPGSQESLEAGCSHCHLPPCALHACNQPLHAHRSDPQSPPAMLCWAHAGLEMLRSALVSLMFLKAMLHVQFTAAGSLCYDKRFCPECRVHSLSPYMLLHDATTEGTIAPGTSRVQWLCFCCCLAWHQLICVFKSL